MAETRVIPTVATKDMAPEQMTKEQLIAERARLQRSQGNNPQEEPWTPQLFERLQSVQASLTKLGI